MKNRVNIFPYLGIHDKLVSGMHLVLLLSQRLDCSFRQGRSACSEWNFLLLDDSLLLGWYRRSALCGRIDIHRGRFLLLLNFFDVGGLKRHDTMEIQSGLELDTRRVALGISWDLRRIERAK
jgi:hypothetical protein